MSRVQALCDLIVLIFRRCSERQPIVITVDDCHWLDASSWAVIHALSAGGARIMLVLVTRTMNGVLPDRIDSKLRNMQSPCMLWLRLEGLTSDDIIKAGGVLRR